MPVAPTAVMVLTLALEGRRPTGNRHRAELVVPLLAAAQLSAGIDVAAGWRQFLLEIREDACEVRELLPFERLRVAADRLSRWSWGWTTPTLSLLAVGGCSVGTLTDNPPGPDYWVPFNSQDPGLLLNPRRFGVD